MESDVVNTGLVFLRFLKMRGVLDRAEWAREVALLRETLEKIGAAHWKEFLAAWPADPVGG